MLEKENGKGSHEDVDGMIEAGHNIPSELKNKLQQAPVQEGTLVKCPMLSMFGYEEHHGSPHFGVT